MGKKRKTYSQEFKLMVVEDCLFGKSGGITKIAKNMIFPKITWLHDGLEYIRKLVQKDQEKSEVRQEPLKVDLERIRIFVAERGLELSKKKTKVVNIKKNGKE